jgi:hypothetical protein
VTSTATFLLYTKLFFSDTCSAARLPYQTMASDSLQVNGSRPANVRHPTAPGMMMNAHFANVGDDASKEAYENGVQVIDEDKVFKCVRLCCASGQRSELTWPCNAVPTSPHTSTSRRSSPLASTTT